MGTYLYGLKKLRTPKQVTVNGKVMVATHELDFKRKPYYDWRTGYDKVAERMVNTLCRNYGNKFTGIVVWGTENVLKWDGVPFWYDGGSGPFKYLRMNGADVPEVTV